MLSDATANLCDADLSTTLSALSKDHWLMKCLAHHKVAEKVIGDGQEDLGEDEQHGISNGDVAHIMRCETLPLLTILWQLSSELLIATSATAPHRRMYT